MRFRLYRDRAYHHDHDAFAAHHQPPTAVAGVALLFFFVLLVLAVRIALWWKGRLSLSLRDRLHVLLEKRS
jgi:hypothetical protein